MIELLWKHKRLAVDVASVVLLVVLFFMWSYERAAATKAERGREAAELTLGGEVVAHEASRRQLKAFVESDADLRRQLEELKNRAPDVVVKTVERVVTKEVPAQGVPRPADGGACAPCLLAPGDLGRVRCTVASFETSLGNLVVRGRGEAVRTSPAPETVLLSSDFDATLSKVVSSAQPGSDPDRPWSLEVGASWGRLDPRPSEYRATLTRRVVPMVYLGATAATPDGKEWRASVDASARVEW